MAILSSLRCLNINALNRNHPQNEKRHVRKIQGAATPDNPAKENPCQGGECQQEIHIGLWRKKGGE
jgi:hypothetical protein